MRKRLIQANLKSKFSEHFWWRLAMNVCQYGAKRPYANVTKFTNTTIEIDTTKPLLVVTSINQPPLPEG